MAGNTYLESQKVLCPFQRQELCFLNSHSDFLHNKNPECLALVVFPGSFLLLVLFPVRITWKYPHLTIVFVFP